jgi:hypothetical protein
MNFAKHVYFAIIKWNYEKTKDFLSIFFDLNAIELCYMPHIFE